MLWIIPQTSLQLSLKNQGLDLSVALFFIVAVGVKPEAGNGIEGIQRIALPSVPAIDAQGTIFSQQRQQGVHRSGGTDTVQQKVILGAAGCLPQHPKQFGVLIV